VISRQKLGGKAGRKGNVKGAASYATNRDPLIAGMSQEKEMSGGVTWDSTRFLKKTNRCQGES